MGCSIIVQNDGIFYQFWTLDSQNRGTAIFTVSPAELDDEQEHLICHRPKQSSVLLATDFVQPCDFMVNVDDSIWRTAV
jgi:hypothetical protein